MYLFIYISTIRTIMHLPHPITYYRNWKYKNTALLFASIILFFSIAETQFIHNAVTHIGTLGYPGIFLAGMFYISTFTVAPALAILYAFTSVYSPLTIALIAGLGSLLGDLILFRFFKDSVVEELKPLFHKLEDSSTFYRLFHTPYFFWLTPILGAFIIASPFPDEVGIGMLGISRINYWQFIALSFVLDGAGIFLILHAARLF
ncbi:MAG: hypothetical protein UY31_C0026G0003 [Candidatus Wolfebacteria bacterium GW2011_GWE1_48_7]|uniref:TVP38/TMEM64 family membrane protein n=2 Tax=Candidatus Wolfeibacteriota TaxID=1752735 RepID=A0A0G1U719_9BACT|nr:MAG: hypothetical protein UX49_C0030G0014 [Candidatus Wolfebacteria bacterium GW2011_GWC2_46_275]KKU41269.1 MAG: hypothetical protein UX58_C0009G0012 [Candidatus Wolfebacteria bacterium GW2011_GWB2_46_69]KKU53632.1 MAG: hypothetical protein UX76_C0012G0012 [Candidatus Wolfebacteria bacterium GW2011_GWC1_47_103]KKU59401.1 MAG: hypothetical protein UX83_C0005G0020 [Candidatus Wolfebacteria bacterium GW2011_GWE2_47_12]KKU65563.1 MAG: hypothetical protein UX90_C0003G0025 [Candidatus Wolfebacteri